MIDNRFLENENDKKFHDPKKINNQLTSLERIKIYDRSLSPIYFDLDQYRHVYNNCNAVPDYGFESNFKNKNKMWQHHLN